MREEREGEGREGSGWASWGGRVWWQVVVVAVCRQAGGRLPGVAWPLHWA